MNNSRNYMSFLFFVSIGLVFLIGCGGSKSIRSPQVYSGPTKAVADSTDAKDEVAEDGTVKRKPVYVSNNSNRRFASIDTEKETDIATSEEADGSTLGTSLKAHQSESNSNSNDMNYYGQMDTDDSASAVDDDIWRSLELADEYHALGVIANREGSWEEAQYYFEKGLKILSQLDIETESESDPTPEAEKYSKVLNNIVADYRVSLRSLGRLEEDVSAAVLIERFGDLGSSLSEDIQVYKDEIKPVTYDLPIVINERVKNSIVYFQTVANEAFNKYLRRSKKYTPTMKKILRQYELPEDLIYLSLVESGYNPNAYSWARAMGLWQFISSTGRLYGLKRDWWIDERKDPIKSTHAACKFLKELYTRFGSWELAMAAYNGGPGRVSRTIDKQGTIDFWKMRLRRQTMDYVPLIMAATIIGKNPEKYGFDVTEFEDEVVWEEVTINRCLDLKDVAHSLNCSLGDLKDLNPELLRNYTPPNVKKYILKIPKGHTEKFWASFDSMPSPKETSWVRHTIRRGETVSTIASKYGVSQYAILEANNLRSSRIYAGKSLIVPVPLDRNYSSVKNDNYTANNSIYVVRSGDTMWDIARAFGTSVSALRTANSIGRGSRIYVGQKLRIPATAAKLAQNSQSINSAPQVADRGSTKTYKVSRGDSLWEIARRYGTTTSYLRQLNGLGRSSRIYPGQILKVTGNAGGYVTHKVRRGETLGLIARKYRTTIAKIMAQNNIENPDQIQVGYSLRIYTY